MRAFLATAAVLICLALLGCGGGGDSTPTASIQGPSADQTLRARFCAYDSTTHGDIVSCFENTTAAQVNQFDTNASKYAEGQIGCLKDSGPFCR